ncbi:MAG TPA: hypothetical protein VMJ66_16920 [Geobacteraceae bacterium]|nr:hypothetical protein [Geobacteraceae bacterium]
MESNNMTEQSEGKKRFSRLKRIILRVAGVTLLVVAALYLLLNAILNSPPVNSRISTLLTETLHQPSAVTGVTINGGTITVRGLAIANPPGFAAGNLLTVRSLSVTPSWGALLAGRKSFSAITASDLKLSLVKDSAGAWNFSGLSRLSSGKKTTSETFIKRLVLERSAVSLNGRGIEDISLAINDLSTGGTTGSGILLTFRDDYDSTYRISGNARLGQHPDLDLSLDAPKLSFKALRGLNIPFDPEKGMGNISLKAALHGDELKLGGNGAFTQLTMRLKGEEIPLSGAFDLSGRYDRATDAASLDRCELRVDDLTRLHGRGRIDHLRKEREFSAELAHDGVELKNAAALLPSKLRRDFVPAGTILPGAVRVAGSAASGVTSGHAVLVLRNGELRKGGRVLADGVMIDAALDRERAGWSMHARLSREGRNAVAPLRFREIPITAMLSERFQPVQANIPSFSFSYEGIPVKGEAAYRSAGQVPLSIRLDVKDAPVTVLARSFPVKDMEIAGGSMTASVSAAGSGPGEFQSNVVAGLKELSGIYQGKKFALAGLSARGEAGAHSGKLTATGSLKADGGLYDGRKLAASFACKVADGRITLNGGALSFDQAQLAFTEISGPIPRKIVTPEGSSLPLLLHLTGIRFRQGESGVDGLGGELNARLVSAANGQRIEGSGTITAPGLVYLGKNVGSLAGRFVLARGKGSADLTGKLLDGTLTASANGDPFSTGREVAFSADLAGVTGRRLTDVIGKTGPVQVSGGTLNVRASGSYNGKEGLRCRAGVSGSNFSLAGKTGKAFFSDGGVRLDADWGNGDLLISDGKFNIGKGPAFALHGKVAHAASAQREGELDVALPRVAVATLFDAFANILPRALQEANVAGDIAVDGRLRLNGNRAAVAGKMTLSGGSLEIPGQKLVVADISGAVPFALDFSGSAAATSPERMSFSRENYPRLLTVMQKQAKGEHNLTIGKISFGTTEFAVTALDIRADNGMTEISSLTSGLFAGELLGRGFVRYQGGVQYGGDILVHDLSLRELCNSYPSIKGYLSGKVDGFLSLLGSDRGLNDIKGLLAVWARSSRDEKMLVSREFLQKLAGKNIRGMFFQTDRPFDRGDIEAYLEKGYLTFATLDIMHTNFLGMKDLSVSVAPVQNRIGLDHLLTTIREAASRGKAATGGAAAPAEKPPATEFKWEE